MNPFILIWLRAHSNEINIIYDCFVNNHQIQLFTFKFSYLLDEKYNRTEERFMKHEFHFKYEKIALNGRNFNPERNVSLPITQISIYFNQSIINTIINFFPRVSTTTTSVCQVKSSALNFFLIIYQLFITSINKIHTKRLIFNSHVTNLMYFSFRSFVCVAAPPL